MSDQIVDPTTTEGSEIFVEPWSSAYDSPMQIDEDAEAGGAEIMPEEGFAFVAPTPAEPIAIAFVDGVRRQEAAVSTYVDGHVLPGITGAYGVGAVICEPDKTPIFSSEIVERLLVWSRGGKGTLLPLAGGWSWKEAVSSDAHPGAPMRRLQEMMRQKEATLGDQLAQEGYLVLLDGTLWFASTYDKRNIAGYVKTHHVRLLPEAESKQLPELPAGWRTSLFRLTRSNRYGLYLRLAPRGPYAPPMAGIVRLEFAGSLPLDEARAMAHRFAVTLPRFAGVAHADPRAPQNLQPIGALETRLRHLLGDSQLAERAARDAVAAHARNGNGERHGT
ncbi:MAG TPA: hypothetical protein VGF98_05295 [Candidatus Tumulicola sp.]|jgi:hypothetical protein